MYRSWIKVKFYYNLFSYYMVIFCQPDVSDLLDNVFILNYLHQTTIIKWKQVIII